MSEETPTTAGQAGPPPPPHEPAPGPPPEPQQPAQEPWATRFGLVRPRHGRILAGVCAAIGRATNTDPLLWRVLIGVLAIFGVGIIIYLAGWLLTPAEGDTASPVEALFGRGHSSTSSLFTLIIGVIAVVMLGALTDSWAVAVIGAVALVVAAMVINPKVSQQRPAAPAVPPPAHYPPSSYGPPGQPPVGQPPASYPSYAVEPPTEPIPPVAPYQPPFAPHGPYQPVTAVPAPPKFEPKPKPEPSRLGRFTFGLMLIALGVVGIADLTQRIDVPGGVYVAAALATIGVGLIIGAWFGRARGFIFLGLVAALLLPAVATAPEITERSRAGSVVWDPRSIDRLSDHYEHRFGEATLDLTSVDFTGQDREISANISFGQLRILLPPNVDTEVLTDVSFGDAQVFHRDVTGVGVNHSNEDLGEDGEGGGKLVIRLNVRFSSAEVSR